MKRIYIALALAFAVSAAMSAQEWAPAGNDIKTPWAAQVNPATPLPEYPRPQMVRAAWQNLNGLWEYAITGKSENAFPAPEGKILVPFAVESSLSGVKKDVGPDNALWYRRSFTVPRNWKGKSVLLHFGAVDWKAEVWVNGKQVGVHTGGYAPFSFDISPLLKKSGRQEIVVRVEDASDLSWQPRGKQVFSSQGIWYTPVTGIWQTVWLEAVPQARIASYYAVPDIDAGKLSITVDAENTAAGDIVKVALKEGGIGYSAEKPSLAVLASAEGTEVEIPVPGAKLWSPDSPYLYGLEISILRKGKVIDKVEGYTAMRKISRIKKREPLEGSSLRRRGYNRLALNNETLFQFGPLDQGWWPDGLYTAPSDEALRFDIEKTREWGFNMIRKHIKTEPARWYYWCDVLGMLVWQDMPSIADHSKDASASRPAELVEVQKNKWSYESFLSGTDCIVPQEWKDNYYKEWGEIIEALKGFPCIVVWVPFNEAWGQFDTEKAVEFTREADPTRLINPASGGNYYLCGDILDSHHYPDPQLAVFESSMINVIGEYGGIGYLVPGHVWRPAGDNWGYSGLCKSPEEVLNRYRTYAERLKVFISVGCAAAVYTQTTDVELELNGLMTYDRLEKFPAGKIREINKSVIGK